ncbi:MAG: hypothetical protein V3T86_05770 [Planctomycetota bacterium]
MRVDNTPYVEMFAEHAKNQEAVAQATRALGKNGHEKAVDTLFGERLQRGRAGAELFVFVEQLSRSLDMTGP